jgi:tetratricopeptide (TPR) repeat protein
MQETEAAVPAPAPAPKRSVFSAIAYWILLGMGFFIPVFFLPLASISPQFGTSFLFGFGAIVALASFIIAGLATNSLDFPKPSRYVLACIGIVPLAYACSALASGFSRQSLFGYTFDVSTVGFILLGFAYLLAVSLLFRDKVRIFYGYLAFLVSSLLLSLFIGIRLIFGTKALSFGIFTALTSTPIGSWNNLGIFFGICVIISLLTYQMASVSRLVRILLLVALFLSLFFLVLVNFSLIWLILAATSFLFILYSVSSSAQYPGFSWRARILAVPLYPLFVLVISAAFFIWGAGIGGTLSTKLGVTNLEVRPDFGTTMSIAKGTLADHLMFGSGPNTFVNQWLTYKPDEIVSTVFWNTDFPAGFGLIPTFAVTTGIVGMLSWLLFLGFYLYLGLKSIFGAFADSFVKYLLTSSFFVSLYLWIMAFAYVPSAVIFILTLFFTGLFFASVYVAGIIPLETRRFSGAKGFVFSLGSVALFAALIALGYGLYKNSASLWYFQKSSYALSQDGDITASEQDMLNAIAFVKGDVYFRALAQIELLKLNAIAQQDTSKVKPADIQQQFSDVLTNAIKAGLAARDVDPDNYLNWVALGQVYDAVSGPALKIEGAADSAEFAYTEALKRNPKNPGILVLLSRLAAGQNDLAAARNYALQAIQMKSNYLDAYFVLSQIEVSDNNLKAAVDSVTAASVIDPTNPAIFFQLGLLKYNEKDYAGAIAALEKATQMTPDYANAKYFLGLSYEAVGRHADAITQFEDIKVTNPDSAEVDAILANLKAGKPIFTGDTATSPEKGKTLPVKENLQ